MIFVWFTKLTKYAHHGRQSQNKRRERSQKSSVTASPGTRSSPGAGSSSRGASCLVMSVGWGRARDRRSSMIWSLWGNSQPGPENPFRELPLLLVVNHRSKCLLIWTQMVF
jgi:hypothetical protein